MKPLIIALHGFGASPEVWEPFLPLLLQYGNIATPFLPGHFRQTDQIGVNEFADTLLEQHPEFGEQPVILIGHSLGGAVAAVMADILPQVLGYISVDTFLLPYGQLTEEQKNSFSQGFVEDYPTAATRLLEKNLKPDVPEEIRQQLYNGLLDLEAGFAATLWRNMLDWQPNLEILQQQNIPLFAINGSLFPEQQRTRYQSLWQETVIADAWHFPMEEAPEAFSNALRKILDTLVES